MTETPSTDSDLAVEIVDAVLGYTVEFSPDPHGQREDYAMVERILSRRPAAPTPDEQPAPSTTRCPSCNSFDNCLTCQGNCSNPWHRAAPSPDEDTRREVELLVDRVKDRLVSYEAARRYGIRLHLDHIDMSRMERMAELLAAYLGGTDGGA